MKMIRALALFGGVALVFILVSSCQLLNELGAGGGNNNGNGNNGGNTPKPDVAVTSVTATYDSNQLLSGVDVAMTNHGTGSANNIAVNLILSDSNPVGGSPAGNHLITSVSVSIPAGQNLTQSFPVNTMLAGSNTNGWPVAGQYYFGAMVDPNNVSGDTNPSNNTGASQTTVWAVNNSYSSYEISGAITAPGTITYTDATGTSVQLATGNYDVYIGAIDANNALLTSNTTGPQDPSALFVPGFQKLVGRNYTAGVGFNAQQSLTVGIPTNGSYAIAGFIDVNHNGKLDFGDGVNAHGNIEPVGTLSGPPTSAPATVPYNSDTTVTGFSF
jgi:hypothetical protein